MDFESFCKDPKTHDAIFRNFEIIGEASYRISQDYKNNHNNIPWDKMMSMRNKLIHGYFEVDFEVVWNTIKKDLPDLESMLRELLK